MAELPLKKPLDDRLNPVLVKELRQQLRSNSFVITFLAFQCGLLLAALAGLVDTDHVTSRAFWFVLLFWLYVVMPFRALFILRAEFYENTLEPMLLTTLKPKRIVLGKWWALMLQNVIVISSVLPYVIIRYFMGGEELATDLIQIFISWQGSLPLVSWMMVFICQSSDYLWISHALYQCLCFLWCFSPIWGVV